jgi:hypothetical protein
MKHLLLAAAITLLAAPASAQFYPNLAALRYCRLRQIGVNSQDAMSMAIRENAALHRPTPLVNYRGTWATVDVAEFADVVFKLCPNYAY